ncbi:hypothetical protein FOL47_009763, partial [Perkinsus chesapeaki]
ELQGSRLVQKTPSHSSWAMSHGYVEDSATDSNEEPQDAQEPEGSPRVMEVSQVPIDAAPWVCPFQRCGKVYNTKKAWLNHGAGVHGWNFQRNIESRTRARTGVRTHTALQRPSVHRVDKGKVVGEVNPDEACEELASIHRRRTLMQAQHGVDRSARLAWALDTKSRANQLYRDGRIREAQLLYVDCLTALDDSVEMKERNLATPLVIFNAAHADQISLILRTYF